ncbi:PD-(D/E)XK motif protein [Mesorhizobium sp. M7A.F.Ca.US.006.01.1.1]|uniref:PD-(D/E)XK motif protein n=1 Tax=Mesorhizobium sp. M7A.F.Ca.US.006.01.1.1 TaxID=2496707 RepID=UPI000FCA65BD|nr:PD-(D/E)XK motif protein [Mesorhizobium sp. M7A.F.Ca.US.006.01.1.1]RUZ75078.1 PD-(D/E)XK motif protein [Mesorhizobium sp. M7A.F.Ca.US.006.01.1.1]
MALLNEHEELLSAWRSLSRAAETTDGWRTIPIGIGRCRAGVRFPAGDEALLVGFSIAAPAATDLPQGRGFSVSRVGDAPSGGFDVWFGVSRKPTASLEMFTLMAADLLASVSAAKGEEQKAYYQFLSRIRSWQQFMERPRDRRLSEEEELGLFGELTIVGRLLDRGVPPSVVMQCWKGPANGLRDFMGEMHDVEVKATISPNGFPARISSLEQLDDVAGRSVFLAALRFSLQDAATSLPALIADIREKAGGDGRIGLERNLLLAGYDDAHADEYVRCFEPMDERIFRMGDGFPRLSRSSAPLAVRAAKYELDLDLVDIATVGLDEVFVAFGGALKQ